MSRRFGRNQKRRMRADLAAKESSIISLVGSRAMDQGLLSHQSGQIAELKDLLHEVRSMVGRFAVTAGEPVMEGYAPRADDDSFRKDVYQPPMVVACYQDYSMATTLKFHIETMRLLQVQAIGDSLRRQMHCLVNLRGEQSVYSISEHALDTMTASELETRLLPQVSRQLARHLVGQIITKRRGRFA